jgi:hypothetical protein
VELRRLSILDADFFRNEAGSARAGASDHVVDFNAARVSKPSRFEL